MLSLRLKSGEYLTIGDNIIVQVFRQKGNSIEVAVQAPKQVPICRGHRGGLYEQENQRPEGLKEAPAPRMKQ